MQIVTATCSDCGTIVAGNVLEEHRVVKCPQIDCEAVLRFDDLPEGKRRHILGNKERYQL